MLVALRSPKGTQRIELQDADKLSSIYNKVATVLGAKVSEFSLYRQQNGKGPLPNSHTQSVRSVGIKHGDSLFIRPANQQQQQQAVATEPDEDPIDRELHKADGRIYRKRDARLCQHSESAGCLHCAPLEPYDAEYLNSLDPPVKYLPFHAYLRKIQAGKYKGALANISVRKRPNCRNHDQDGICSSCMPDPLTLELQQYRHTDYVQFEHASIVDKFVDYWRRSGQQRVGLLIGRYERHAGVSLGIKAVVAAIYEPPQETHKNHVKLLPDELRDNKLKQLLQLMQLQIIGWVFTDLLPSDEPGKVRHFRGTADTFFLSAEEAITAGHFQLQHPNKCPQAENGHFGSKFVTCVLTGDTTNQIAPAGYQLSNQGMALVRDQLLVPTFDAPELAWSRERTYQGDLAPDVFYSTTNEYGTRIKCLARPLPVEFLLTDMPVGVARDSSEHTSTFHPMSEFPIENRAELGELQSATALQQVLQLVNSNELLRAICDFHLILYLYTDPVLAMSDEDMRQLISAVLENDADQCKAWLQQSPSWELIRTVAFSQSAAGWQCKHCTFHNSNQQANSCEICGLPK